MFEREFVCDICGQVHDPDLYGILMMDGDTCRIGKGNCKGKVFEKTESASDSPVLTSYSHCSYCGDELTNIKPGPNMGPRCCKKSECREKRRNNLTAIYG